MSEFPKTPDLFPKPIAPHALVGAASPLWGLFAGAAATGVAFWWMTRWTRPQNLEALFDATLPALGDTPAPAVEAALAGDLPDTVVGGEGAPFGVVAEALAEAEAEAEAAVEPAAQAAETVTEAVVEPAAEATEAAVAEVAEAVPPEPVVEAAPELEPPVEAAPTPRPRAKPPAEPRAIAPKSGPAASPKAD